MEQNINIESIGQYKRTQILKAVGIVVCSGALLIATACAGRERMIGQATPTSYPTLLPTPALTVAPTETATTEPIPTVEQSGDVEINWNYSVVCEDGTIDYGEGERTIASEELDEEECVVLDTEHMCGDIGEGCECRVGAIKGALLSLSHLILQRRDEMEAKTFYSSDIPSGGVSPCFEPNEPCNYDVSFCRLEQ